MKAMRAQFYVTVGAASLFLSSGAVAQVVINEFVDDERNATAGQITPDSREFVELYNAGASPVDISGWQLLTKQLGTNFNQPAGLTTYTLPSTASEIVPAGGFYVIKAPGVPIPSGVGYYEPTFPTGRDLLPDGVTVIGGSPPAVIPEKSTSANYVLELHNVSGTLIDAVADETFRGTQRGDLTSEQIAQTAGGSWGQDSSYNVSSPNTRFSNGRFLDGRDTNNNGYDFGMLPLTPGSTNNQAINATGHAIPDVDALGFEEAVTAYYASIVMPKAIDPTNADGNTLNPSSTGTISPQGGKAIIAYDKVGGGNAIYSKELVRKFDLYAYIQTGALGTTTATDTQDSEATIYGLGTTDGLFGMPNPAGLNSITSSTNGSTGYGWVIERVENYNGGAPTSKTYLELIDFGDGGDSIASDNEWQIMKLYDLSATASGWHRLSIEYDSTTGIVTGKNDGDTTVFTESGDYNNDGVVNTADYVLWRKNQGTTNMLKNDGTGGMIGAAQYAEWRVQYGNTSTPGLIGSFYVGYRENMLDGGGNLSGARPPTFDMIGGGGTGSVAATVPEPGALGLAITGACWAWGGRRRKTRSAFLRRARGGKVATAMMSPPSAARLLGTRSFSACQKPAVTLIG